jgi:hypothetical protein
MHTSNIYKGDVQASRHGKCSMHLSASERKDVSTDQVRSSLRTSTKLLARFAVNGSRGYEPFGK